MGARFLGPVGVRFARGFVGYSGLEGTFVRRFVVGAGRVLGTCTSSHVKANNGTDGPTPSHKEDKHST